jgi:glycosyltransferase involved in cell wall biosynthesis
LIENWSGRADEIRTTGTSSTYSQPGNPRISILLPTFRRPDALKRTLLSLENQSTDKKDYEVIVVDDGSGDETESFLCRFAAMTKLSFMYQVLKKNGGPARARNFGLSRCRGDVVLIIGDDIEAEPDLVAKHIGFHEENPDDVSALLGFVGFPEALQPTSFMRWLASGGRKYFFNYQDIPTGGCASPLNFYTSNVSVKAVLLNKSGWFDESFAYASHEDLELGFRLAEQGMRLYYDSTARGAHWHMLTVQGIARRVYLMGYSARLFWQKVADKGGAIRRAGRFFCAWFSTAPPCIRLWNWLRSRDYIDGRSYPVSWHVLLFLGFFIGLADSGKCRKPRR